MSHAYRDAAFEEIWARVAPFTMTSPERGYALWQAVNAVVDANIDGSFVECGVWKGGSAMLIALTLLQKNSYNRDIYLFDTFSGMTEPTEYDRDLNGEHASVIMEGSQGQHVAEIVKAAASLDVVREAIASTGYDMAHVKLIKGDVRETLRSHPSFEIALLRLDTDFYDSTLIELEKLYPDLTRRGIIIIDDYGHWQGAKKAVDDYFASDLVEYSRPFFLALDYTGRIGVKIEPRRKSSLFAKPILSLLSLWGRKSERFSQH